MNEKLDYERGQGTWNKMLRSSSSDWDKNLETIVQWAPFFDEEDLHHQVIHYCFRAFTKLVNLIHVLLLILLFLFIV